MTSVLQWLAAPLSGATEHFIASHAFWHARFMVLAWGVCLPLGVLVARYMKITPNQNWPQVLDNKFWWHAHRALQTSGVVAMSVGVYLVWHSAAYEGSVRSVAGLHQVLGWTVLVLGWSQMLSGILRGSKGGPTDSQMAGDHYDMSRWRVVFEYVHKSLGWLAIGLSVAVIVLGLLAADAPRWMLVVLALWWSTLTAVHAYLQQHGCCVDTYQAIWGTDPSMPGMQRKPIGWGIKRTLQHPWRASSTQP